MKFVRSHDVVDWFRSARSLSEFGTGIGRRRLDEEYVADVLRIPRHLQFAVERMTEELDEGETLPAEAFDSIPFHSLCTGLFLPLASLAPVRTAQMFGTRTGPPLAAAEKEALVRDFLDREVGLTLVEKLGCALGDAFHGRRSTIRRDSLLRLLRSVEMTTRNELLDRLTRVGEVAVLFAESRPQLVSDNPLTSAEVLRTLRFLPDCRTNEKFELLRSLLQRCGKLEAYFLARLALRKAGLGFEYQGSVVARLLAEKFGVPEEQVSHAMALTDAFEVARVLRDEGADGLKRIQLQPLVPVKPTLATGTTDELEPGEFPVWVERKYDGIRLMLHKSTDARGTVLCGAYTRNRGDWLELVPGLDTSIRQLPAANGILDGELYGTVLDLEGVVRPATVYEVYSSLQGEVAKPVNLKFAAFDLIYCNGSDLTGQPLQQRRQLLQGLVAPLSNAPLPVPFVVSEGQLAGDKNDLNRLFHHFRAQGYEGIITKNLSAPYLLATRDPNWRKRKPEITLDLVVIGATYAVTTKEYAGTFGSYVVAARKPDGGYQFVGDVAGVDRVRDAEIQHEITREGLMTGARIERPSASGVRPGVELRPHIVVTVKFEGITREQGSGELSLRDPKLAVIRSDKSALEADTVGAIEEMYLRQRVG